MIETYVEEGAEFVGDVGEIRGTAFYACTVEKDYSSDIGGVDRWTCMSAELVRFEIDALHLTRDQVALVTCEAVVRAEEERIAEVYDAEVRERVSE